MCTVTFIPRDLGYHLAVNRDEQLARIAGLPPQLKFLNERSILYPSEPTGGTWISLNDARVTFALVNWYSVAERVRGGAVSRGQVVKGTSSAGKSDEADKKVASLPLNFINPFRLIGVFPDERAVVEWRWDLKKLVRRNCEWKPQQWISSGHDEPKAQSFRSSTFRRALQKRSAGTLKWLQQLHASHDPERGPFSTCMHRADAATVSYTAICVARERGLMKYHAGSPCMPRQQAVRNVEISFATLERRGRTAKNPLGALRRVTGLSGEGAEMRSWGCGRNSTPAPS